ncbi:MAG: hypothetical protein K2P75_04925 [Sphingobacteriaceae bacterium]|nr:hypothetical protein [Sphingobacteriaceae bacterium]
MDKIPIKLHPKAQDFLFEYFAILQRIFTDVLGQLDIAYISIALINGNREIFFLSSKPSIEQNLIAKGLWEYDGAYQINFIHQKQPKLWSELAHVRYPELLKQYKQDNHDLVAGISIPFDDSNYRGVFSFGFKKITLMIQQMPSSYHEKLLAIGLYCLKNIRNGIPFPDKKRYYTKPQLELITNN